jgi:hypothetical protein
MAQGQRTTSKDYVLIDRFPFHAIPSHISACYLTM